MRDTLERPLAEPEEGPATPDEAGPPDGAGSQESREDED